MRRGLALALALSAVLFVAGCGGSGDSTVTEKKKVIHMVEKPPGYHSNGPPVSTPSGTGGATGSAGSGGKGINGRPSASSSDALDGVDTLGDQLGAEVGVAVGAPGSAGPTAVGGSLQSGSAWSTIKVPISLRVVQDAGGPSKLTATQKDLISRAITLSDNEAAAELFSELESTYGGLQKASDAVTGELRNAGDDTTVVSTVGRDSFSTYGQTEWTLPLQEQFMAALAGGCISNAATKDYLLDEMSNVTSDPWGLGSAGVGAKWKGGWGPGTDGRYLLRQMGVMKIDGKDVVVSIAVRPSDGSFETGQTDATALAQWVAQHAGPAVGAPTGC